MHDGQSSFDTLIGLSSVSTSGGVNFTPAVAARSRNKTIVEVIVALGLADEPTALAAIRARIDEYDRRSLERLNRLNAERGA